MPLNARQSEILKLLQRRGRVRVDELVLQYATTPQTIRRDLRLLEQAGRAQRFHGGAVFSSGGEYTDFEARRLISRRAKDAIAQAAASLIPDDATVFINIGTTTEAAALALKDHSGLTVITDNVNTANALRQFSGLDVLIAGGAIRAHDGAIVGDAAVQFIRQFRVDYALIGAAAIEPEGALLDHDLREAQVASAIMDIARHVILAADATKFSRSAPVCIGDLRDVHSFVTDKPLPQDIAGICSGAGVQVIEALDAKDGRRRRKSLTGDFVS
ncbi:DeoR family glycerol-3-phosphate regulon repressor [Rubricella aquisinus]|uniref:DeoR family glycerol-3-phosphate regulon repressor n=1 Tax=Rubricella aquisinus TaxID=2028108 RepID=A0A840WNM2_9RHOB|nr:DeoR/GlpR family DNA-binding transcription regulator [Rubricella aquisinus]MBB5515252.1 DeoR family glycerol-3-phosphate regulon repressor [Rubricella aquisinus]